MYNPKNIADCEKERRRVPKHKKKAVRHTVDTAMTLVGLVASVSSIPQIIKLYETQDPTGISLTTQLLALGAVISWFLYGLYIKNKPLAITSGLSTLVLGTVVIQMFLYS